MKADRHRVTITLGWAGLLPQIFAVCLFLVDVELRWYALVGGFGYAAFIFSFLGGVWWGVALREPGAPAWIYAAGVAPSLIALALYLPGAWGWDWPQPQMLVLAPLIMGSPIIDGAIDRDLVLPVGWMRMRWHLSLGLGLMTLALAVI